MSGEITTKFYLADDIRLENSGKQTLVGLYADDTIVLLAKEKLSLSEKRAALLNFAFMITFFGLTKGVRLATVSILGPNGKTVGSGPAKLNLETKSDGAVTNFIVNAPQFPVIELGRYSVTVDLAGDNYEFAFNLQSRLAEPEAKTDAPMSAPKRTKRVLSPR